MTVTVKSCVVLAATVAELGETETVIAGTVTVAGEVFVASVTEVAVMVTATSLGGALAGALNVTDVFVTSLSVPAPDTGEMLQITPALPGSLVTVAVKVCLLPAATIAPLGSTETTIAGTTTFADADVVGVAAEVAVMVTAKSFDGGFAGRIVGHGSLGRIAQSSCTRHRRNRPSDAGVRGIILYRRRKHLHCMRDHANVVGRHGDHNRRKIHRINSRYSRVCDGFGCDGCAPIGQHAGRCIIFNRGARLFAYRARPGQCPRDALSRWIIGNRRRDRDALPLSDCVRIAPSESD